MKHLSLFAFALVSLPVLAQYHNPWNVDVAVSIGPSNLTIDERLPDESEFLQSPFQVPYDTSSFLFNYDYQGIWINSQGRVDYGVSLDFVHDEGFDIGLSYRRGFVPRSSPRVFVRSLSFEENYTRSIELDMNTFQIQGGWNILHERWNISNAHSLRIKAILGFAHLQVDDNYTYDYQEYVGSDSLIIESTESFTWKARGFNWGFGLEYMWYPNKIQSGLGYGVALSFDRSYLSYSEMNRTAYELNGVDQMDMLEENEVSFIFDGESNEQATSPKSFERQTSQTDNVNLRFILTYRFARMK